MFVKVNLVFAIYLTEKKSMEAKCLKLGNPGAVLLNMGKE